MAELVCQTHIFFLNRERDYYCALTPKRARPSPWLSHFGEHSDFSLASNGRNEVGCAERT